jgi:hypothetical protein
LSTITEEYNSTNWDLQPENSEIRCSSVFQICGLLILSPRELFKCFIDQRLYQIFYISLIIMYFCTTCTNWTHTSEVVSVYAFVRMFKTRELLGWFLMIFSTGSSYKKVAGHFDFHEDRHHKIILPSLFCLWPKQEWQHFLWIQSFLLPQLKTSITFSWPHSQFLPVCALSLVKNPLFKVRLRISFQKF